MGGRHTITVNVLGLFSAIDSYVENWSAGKNYGFTFPPDMEGGQAGALIAAWAIKWREAGRETGAEKTKAEAACLMVERMLAEYCALDWKPLVEAYVGEEKKAEETRKFLKKLQRRGKSDGGKTFKRVSRQAVLEQERLEMLRRVFGEIKAFDQKGYCTLHRLLVNKLRETRLDGIMLTLLMLENRLLDYVDMRKDILTKLGEWKASKVSEGDMKPLPRDPMAYLGAGINRKPICR